MKFAKIKGVVTYHIYYGGKIEKHIPKEIKDEIKVSSDQNIKAIRRKVNSGLAGWTDAKKYFEKDLIVFKVNDCQPVESGDNSTWHDPIDHSQRTYYNSSGIPKTFQH